MSAADHLGAYAEGWSNGALDTILGAVSDSFVFDDPNAGKIAKADFSQYFSGMVDLVASIRGSAFEGPFMALTEVVTKEENGVLTASCWWAVPGTDLQGSGLIKVTKDGVVSERLAYYAKLSD
ncbi:MAG: hypothetical protein JKY20_10835 [Alphaproteobacteria bacterium]|nr:hypothetical protein [Alphaproteobacteria bacterium]